jgi:hypothetical protein
MAVRRSSLKRLAVTAEKPACTPDSSPQMDVSIQPPHRTDGSIKAIVMAFQHLFEPLRPSLIAGYAAIARPLS